MISPRSDALEFMIPIVRIHERWALSNTRFRSLGNTLTRKVCTRSTSRWSHQQVTP